MERFTLISKGFRSGPQFPKCYPRLAVNTGNEVVAAIVKNTHIKDCEALKYYCDGGQTSTVDRQNAVLSI